MNNNNALSFPTDFSHHALADVEWWYVYGYLDDDYTLMACVWRYSAGAHQPDGLMLSYALTSLTGGRRWQNTLVDEAMLDYSRRVLKQFQKQKHDFLSEAILEITQDGEIFLPHRKVSNSSFSSTEQRPIDITLGSCRLYHDSAGSVLKLSIGDRSLDLNLSIDLQNSFFPMNQSGVFELDDRKMFGYTHPRTPINGKITKDGIDSVVRGEAWFDHQWGDWWYREGDSQDKQPEWSYFAIQLNDGSSIILNQQVNTTGSVSNRKMMYALLHQPDGTTIDVGQVEIKCQSHVQGLRSNKLYEYGWTIRLPDMDGLLEMTPYHPDHEIYVYSSQPAIMELACQVTGTLQGRSCRGRGFVELLGPRTDLNEFFWGQEKPMLTQETEQLVPRVLDAEWLRKICNRGEPLSVDQDLIQHALIDPVWSMMDRGGKGWRSTWLMTCCYSFGQGEVDPRIATLLPIFELIHTGSLVIDDIQDGSPERRSKAALHKEIGTDLALNVGNFLYFLPMNLLRDADWLSETQRLALYEILMSSMCQGHIGQGIDLMWSKKRYDIAEKIENFTETRKELLELYRLKSGYHIEAIAKVAGIIMQAPQSAIDALGYYSQIFGIVFQMVDDMIDIQEAKVKLGKQEGEDIRNGKMNIVLLHALAELGSDERSLWIKRIFHAPGGDGLANARWLVDQTAAIDKCIVTAQEMLEQAWMRLEILPPTDAKLVIRSAPKWLLHQRKVRQERLRSTGAWRMDRKVG